jgi:hypothetical protein
MDLYIKTQKGKTVRYIPYQPPDCTMHEIEAPQMITLLSTLTISMLMSVEKQLPEHARMGREIRNVEQAVTRLAKLNAGPLNDHLVNVGVMAWNSAIKAMQDGLTGKT